MYGMFYLTKNYINSVLLFFANGVNENREVKIVDFSQIKEFNPRLIKKIETVLNENFEKPYELYYRNIKDNYYLQKTMRDLRISKISLDRPLVRIEDMDIICD